MPRDEVQKKRGDDGVLDYSWDRESAEEEEKTRTWPVGRAAAN